MAFYEVEIIETYSYKAIIDADNEEDLHDVIHEEIPTLIDMGETCIEKIKDVSTLNLDADYDFEEVDEKDVSKLKETCIDLTKDSTFFD